MSSTSTTEAPGDAPTGRAPAALLQATLCLPGLLLVAVTAAMLAGLPFGVDPLWFVEPVTLSEAAALHDNGEVVRLIELGADVNAASDIRPEILTGAAFVMTPLEAAVAAERADMVVLLFEQGARTGPATWSRLMCESARAGADDVREILEMHRPGDAVEDCDQNPPSR